VRGGRGRGARRQAEEAALDSIAGDGAVSFFKYCTINDLFVMAIKFLLLDMISNTFYSTGDARLGSRTLDTDEELFPVSI
jgi:hypothetical protein